MLTWYPFCNQKFIIQVNLEGSKGSFVKGEVEHVRPSQTEHDYEHQ